MKEIWGGWMREKDFVGGFEKGLRVIEDLGEERKRM